MMIAISVAILIIIAGLLALVIRLVAMPKKLETVKKLLKQGKNQAAAKLAKQIAAKDPQNYSVHYYLGKAYLADNRGELALIEFKTVNEHALFDSNLPEIPFRKEFAALLVKYRQIEAALKEYLLLTKLDPTCSDNYFNAAKLYEMTNRKDLALSIYKKCIALNPKNAKAHAAIGYILFQAKQTNEAKRELDLAIHLNPEEYSCYYYLGKILKDAKDLGGAVKAFEKAQRDSEFKQKALIERSTCYMMANRLDNAQIDLQRAIDLDKAGTSNDTLYARYFLAACYEKNRKIDKAIEQWESILKVNRSFRDVGAKLSEYKALEANDNLKDYLTSSDAEFIEICKNTTKKALGFNAVQADLKKFGVQIIATEGKDGDWMSVRKQSFLLRFYRDVEPLEDAPVRDILETAKSSNCTKSFIFASSGFTRTAIAFAENRPVELAGKEKLQQLLEIAAKPDK